MCLISILFRNLWKYDFDVHIYNVLKYIHITTVYTTHTLYYVMDRILNLFFSDVMCIIFSMCTLVLVKPYLIATICQLFGVVSEYVHIHIFILMYFQSLSIFEFMSSSVI